MNKKLCFLEVITFIITVSVIGLASCNAADDYSDIGYCTLAEGMFTRSGDPGGGEDAYCYPTNKAILANSSVISKMNEVWQQTKSYANEERRCEFGFLIFQDRNNMTFYFSPIIKGKDVGKGETASIVFPAETSPELVAAFHTHTTYQYCDSTASRQCGPSSKDLGGSYASLMPCFVYDYEGSVCGGDSKDRPARIYSYGQSSRITHL